MCILKLSFVDCEIEALIMVEMYLDKNFTCFDVLIVIVCLILFSNQKLEFREILLGK